MPYGPFAAALANLTGADIDRLVRDGIPEGAQVDFKQDLSEKSGGLSGWRRGERTISEKTVRELGRMMVGFANVDGGTVVVGVRETEGHPSRADEIDPIPAVAELADRIRRSLLALVDPPLDRLEVAGVATAGDAGVLVIRTPPSMNAPHRVRLKDGFGVFVRREDQTMEATMREVHDIILRRESGVERFERTFRDAMHAFEKRMSESRAGPPDPPRDQPLKHLDAREASPRWAVGWSIFVVPITRIAAREHCGDPSLGFGMQVFVDNKDGARMVSERGGGRPSRTVPAAAVQRHSDLVRGRHEELAHPQLDAVSVVSAAAGFCRSPLRRFSRSR